MKLRSVTIGIPSFNEESNIENILKAVINGNNKSFKLKEIIISDDSTDKTPLIIQNFIKIHPELEITLLHSAIRGGAANAWNDIMTNASGDVLVLYDADIIPDINCTKELVTKLDDNIGICASNPKPISGKGFAIRGSIFASCWLEKVRHRQLSQYTVMGRALSISTNLAKKIIIPRDLISIDLFLQVETLARGYKVIYNPNAIVLFKAAGTFLDFSSQVLRGLNGHNQIMVGKKLNKLSLRNAFSALFEIILKDPRGAISLAICCLFVPYYKFKIKGHDSVLWHTAESTKKI